MATSKAEWYQSGDFVTASVKLQRPSPSQTRGEITPHFEEQYCAIYERGELRWESHLAGRIVPEKCKIIPRRVRVELKLKKAEPETWKDYEIEGRRARPPRTNGGTHVSTDGQQLQNVPPSTAAVATTNATPTPSKSIIPQELTYINHVPHDFYDLGGDTVKVKVQMRQLDQRKCQITFKERSLEFQFQTSDERFLNTHKECETSTVFVWNIQLSGPVDAGACHFDYKPDCLELFLKKRTTGRWKTLESTRRGGHGIVTSSSDGTDSRDRDFNDLNTPTEVKSNSRADVISNDVITTSQGEDSTPKMKDLSLNDDLEGNNGHNWQHPNAHRPQANSPTSPSSTNPVPPSSGGHQYSTSGGHQHSSSGGHVHHCSVHGDYYCQPKQPPAGGSGHHGPSTSKLVPDSTLVASIEMQNPLYRVVQLSRPSLTGLCNLGNSCFMNSVLQCLSNTQPVRDYFINGRHLADINTDNPLGFKGELAKAFSFLIRKLWSGEYEYFAPKKLQSVITSRSSHFGDNAQHDSHEFMSYLLDGLHEDLNRIKKKPQTPSVESDDRPDAEVAEEAWQVYRMRNDSYFVDLFQGLFKSTLVCAVCSKESVTFDPFMSMSVPIPGKLRSLPVFFVPCDPNQVPTKYVLKLAPEGNLELLKGAVTRRTGISMPQLRVFEAFNGKFHTLLSSNRQPIKDIDENDVIIVSEVLSQKVAKEKVVELHVIQRVQFPFFPTKCSSCGRLSSDIAEEGKKIQRCGKCKAVGYCSSDCQRRDWKYHKTRCRGGRPTPVGLPFVVSLPASQLTYSKLASMAEKFARFSVGVVRNHQSTAASSPPASREGSEGTDVAKNGGGDRKTVDEATEKTRPMYVFTPVDRYGDNKEETKPLEDLGDTPLSITSQFLAMDWRNNPKEKDSVSITPKTTMDFRPDPESAGDASDASSLSNDLTLEECLERFTEPESLTQEDSWYCPRCKKHCEATKQMSVWRLPQILILHLKRFSFHNGYYRNKIRKLVKFPLSGLDMSPYLLGEASKLISRDAPPLYDLYSVVYHYGNSYIGHYCNLAKPPSNEGLGENYKWLMYDDEKVYKFKNDKVVDPDAYILFYTRREQNSPNKL